MQAHKLCGLTYTSNFQLPFGIISFATGEVIASKRFRIPFQLPFGIISLATTFLTLPCCLSSYLSTPFWNYLSCNEDVVVATIGKFKFFQLPFGIISLATRILIILRATRNMSFNSLLELSLLQ